MNDQMNNEELLNILLETIKEVSEIIVVRSEFGEIIYSNVDLMNLDYIKLSLLGKNEKEFKIGTKTYRCEKKQLKIKNDLYNLELYLDNTKYNELRACSETDHLTSLINRRGLEKAIIQTIKEFEALNSSFVVVMGDIDKFKDVNDKIGHINADCILRFIASLLKTNVRASDIVGRYGGEEFLMILKACDLSRAYEIVEKMRINISEFELPFDNVKNITMSFGISLYDGTKELKEVIEEADKNLYKSKNNGRNKTTKPKSYQKVHI
ncbi:MAG: GGDEF domain-containing protein [Bacilli bacterium]|nr:GGDEF domain-containing protein [Bacilli bacterium]